MNQATLRTQFLSLLNRSDCTNFQADTLIGQAMQRISRAVRLPSMERLEQVTPTFSDLVAFPVPPDFIQAIDFFVTLSAGSDEVSPGNVTALEHLSYRQLQRIPTNGQPRAYARFQNAFYIKGAVPVGTPVSLYYYGEFSPILTDTDENEIMASSPDLVTYGALALAGDLFDMPKAAAWEQRYTQFLSEVIELSEAADREGGPSAIQGISSSESY